MAHILIIEDDPTLQEAYGFILETDGHTITAAYNGEEGLACTTEREYDVILLDVHMPVMNGMEFLMRYKDARPPDTKIILFSNMIEPSIVKQATALGAYQCVLKSSMTPSAMLKLVEQVTS